MQIAVVVNPLAGGGRMARRWPRYEAALTARYGAIVCRHTQSAGHGIVLANELAAAGADVVIAAGGDGTVSEVANGLLSFAADGRPAPALAVIPEGSGMDFAAAFRLLRDPDAAAAAIAERPRRRIDAGRVRFTGDDGQPAERFFVSVASLGLSGLVDRAVNLRRARPTRAMLGRVMFFVQALKAFAVYRFPEVTITVDGGRPIEARIALVAIANNPSFGGGMRIAPDAKPDDGQFEIVIAKAGSRLGMMRQLPLVYTGGHRNLSSCTFLSGREVTVTALGDEPVWLDLDGESPGQLPATFEMLAGALELRGSTAE